MDGALSECAAGDGRLSSAAFKSLSHCFLSIAPFWQNHDSLKTWQTLFNLNTHARFSRTGSGATSTTGRAVLSASCDATVKPEPVFTFHPTWFVGGLRGREGRDKERGGEMNVLRQLRIVPPLFLALSPSLYPIGKSNNEPSSLPSLPLHSHTFALFCSLALPPFSRDL